MSVADDSVSVLSASRDESKLNREEGVGLPETKLYKRRWIIIVLYGLCSASSSFQWIQYGIINNIISRYYGVSQATVDWFSLVYMATYVTLVVPGSWFLAKFGLRVTLCVGAALNATGALIKLGSAHPSLFWVAITGQVVCALGKVFILGLPAKIAANWFGPNEVSTACSIGVFGNQIGIAAGFLIPPWIVPDVEDRNVVTQSLWILLVAIAIVSTVFAFIIILVFKSHPKIPPSRAQANFLRVKNDSTFVESLKKLMFSRPSFFLIFSYGINAGSFYALSTVLNQEILDSYPDRVFDAGKIGLTMVFTGFAGSILTGLWLDRTKIYKKSVLFLYVATLLLMGLYTATLNLGGIWVIYTTGGLLGFTMTGYIPVGLEYAAEITYPISEGTSSGILHASAQVFGVAFTLCMGQIIVASSVLVANSFLCGALFIGIILTVLIKTELKRQEANKPAKDCLVTFCTSHSEKKVGANESKSILADD